MNEKEKGIGRIFPVSKELKPFIVSILNRRNIFYLDRGNKLKIDLSGNAFHKVVLRAKCELRNEKEDIPYDTTYYVSQVEDIFDLQAENPEHIYFREY